MSDMYGRRMAYRSAARAVFAENALQQEKTADHKIFYAHGYAIHSENKTTGEEIWERDSAFGEVFFDFEKAKEYLLEKFEKRLEKIYRKDKLFEDEAPEQRDIHKQSSEWRREYIEEYIDYSLVISELSSEYGADNSPIDFCKPPKTDWYLRYTGEVRTRYFVFGEKEYECREGDLLSSAGTKFNMGDLVEYCDWEFKYDYPGIYVVLTAPHKPQDSKTPWVNEYELVGIDNDPLTSGKVHKITVHEADLRRINDENLQNCLYREPLVALQRVINEKAVVSLELKEKILNGEVRFNAEPSWRDFPELQKK